VVDKKINFLPRSVWHSS